VLRFEPENLLLCLTGLAANQQQLRRTHEEVVLATCDHGRIEPVAAVGQFAPDQPVGLAEDRKQSVGRYGSFVL
jgi:hypothetical protein